MSIYDLIAGIGRKWGGAKERFRQRVDAMGSWVERKWEGARRGSRRCVDAVGSWVGRKREGWRRRGVEAVGEREGGEGVGLGKDLKEGGGRRWWGGFGGDKGEGRRNGDGKGRREGREGDGDVTELSKRRGGGKDV